VTIPLGFLGQGPYQMAVISDGTSDTTFAERSATVSSSDSLAVSIRARGGFVAKLTP
jgi:hypothetical protein